MCHLANWQFYVLLTHWGRVTHICVSELTIIGSDNDLSPGWRQAIIWTNDGILFIEPLETNFSEILIGIQIFSFKKMCLKMSSAKWRQFCLGVNVLKGAGNMWTQKCALLGEKCTMASSIQNWLINHLNAEQSFIILLFSTFCVREMINKLYGYTYFGVLRDT